MDSYREFILSYLRTCPQIRDTNIEYKIRETFPDYAVKRSTFYRYMKKLREQTGYVSPFASRKTSIRPELPPGYEAQVDFGQYKLRSMYDREVRVYFFVMILSYSRMKFVYFQSKPFTTKTAIEAHQLAFAYFNGRTQTIMYDQDRVFVVSENLGNIIFVREFEEFVKETGYSVVLCRPRDPQCKGKVEEAVGYIKRKYCETPTLKEESLEETFVEVFNGLIANRKEIEENYRLCIDTITDDSEYRRQLEDLNNGCGEVQTLIRSLLMTYSRQDTADDIHEKLKEYEDRLDTMARLKQELDLKIAACAAKRVQITGFLNELMKHDAPLAKFDPLVWQAVINYATVNRDCTITFTFRDGTENTVPIKNGVRPYTKRNKPQEVDGNDG